MGAAGGGAWDDWSAHIDAAEKNLSTTGLVYPDLAEIATLAGELAEDAARPAAARQAFSIALRQWQSLGRTRKAAHIRLRLMAR